MTPRARLARRAKRPVFLAREVSRRCSVLRARVSVARRSRHGAVWSLRAPRALPLLPLSPDGRRPKETKIIDRSRRSTPSGVTKKEEGEVTSVTRNQSYEHLVRTPVVSRDDWRGCGRILGLKLGPRENRCEVRVVRRSRATALGTTHARPRGHFEHAADSVLREVLRRRLRVQVRTRPDAAVSRRARGYRGFGRRSTCASRAKARGVSPRDATSPVGPPSDAFERPDAQRADHPSTRRPLKAYGALRISIRLLAARIAPVFRARARSKCYPSYATGAQLTDPSFPPPSPVSGTSSSPRHRQAPSQGSPSLRGASRATSRSIDPRRPVSGHRAHPACPRFRDTCCTAGGVFKASLDARPVPRTPLAPFARVSRGILTLPIPSSTQAEWRGLGVQQSRGWVHYAIHRPEPHIMLYRCARRPPRPTHAARFSRALFQTSGRRDLARRASDPRPFHPDTRSRARSRFPDAPAAPRHPSRASAPDPTRSGDAFLDPKLSTQHPPSPRSPAPIPPPPTRQAHAQLRPARSHRRRQ